METQKTRTWRPAALPALCLLASSLAAAGAGELTEEQAVERARELVAAREGIAREALRVRRVDAAEWPDGSLDCPEPGKSYPQGATAGFRVLLQNGRTQYRVHVAESRTALCGEPLGARGSRAPQMPLPERPPERQEPAVSGEVPETILDRLRADLLRRAGADPAAIEVLRAEVKEFNDGSLGCPKPGEVYVQMVTPGYHVVLRYDGRSYDYRATRSGHFVLCEGPRAPEAPTRPVR